MSQIRVAKRRAAGPELAISFSVGTCSLGTLLVASTENGICAIFLGDNFNALHRELRRQFPRTKLIRDRSKSASVAKVVKFVERPGKSFPLPLDLRGTPFERSVWQILRTIPPGQTTTYARIARQIGRPNAFRAVGSACAANCVAVAVPCHRVLGTDGSLTGYRWGLERKHALLARESDKRKRA